MNRIYRIDSRKRITIPDEALKAIDAKSGDYIEFNTDGEKVVVKKVKIQS